LTTNRKPHARFRLISKSATLDDPERPLRTLFQNTCVFGAHRENLKEDRPIPSAAKLYVFAAGSLVWVSDPSFWQHKVYADIRGGFPGEGRQTTMGLSKTVIFSTFARYFSEALVVRPTLLYSRLIIQSLAAFTLTPKYAKGHFTLNSVLSC